MKYLVKKSVLLLLVVLAFCACDNSNDNGEVIQPNPHPQSSKTVVNYTGEVEFVVDAPQIRERAGFEGKPSFWRKQKISVYHEKTLDACCFMYAICGES